MQHLYSAMLYSINALGFIKSAIDYFLCSDIWIKFEPVTLRYGESLLSLWCYYNFVVLHDNLCGADLESDICAHCLQLFNWRGKF